MNTDSRSRFLCTSYVREHAQGPLSITSVENGVLRVVAVLYGTENVRSQLNNGIALDDVVARLKAIQHTDTAIPIEQLRKIVWNDFSSDVIFTHGDGNKTKRTTTYITSDEHREQLLLTARNAINTPVHCHDELASVFAVAWTRILGAVMAVAGTMLFVLLWDPARMGRLRGGALALLLGRTGCAIVGVGIFFACCISAWLAIRKRSRYYTCTFGHTAPTEPSLERERSSQS